MSLDKFYHPRNIYQRKNDFKDMAIRFPEFRKICKQDLSGKISIDFKDAESLRVLNKTYLKKDFNLDVNIPPNYLIPTMSLRLNYILWVEDLMNFINADKKDSEIHGIDIGTGSSCVYMLLNGRKNNWHMIGTDIDPESIKYAQENIANNKLDHLLRAILTTEDVPIFSFMSQNEQQYDFCMCNPPFFSTLDELSPKKQKKNANRPPPHNAFSAKHSEVVTKGGEEEFVSKIIRESSELKTRVRVYTTMIGKKKNVPPLLSLIKSVGAKSYQETMFFQGHTTRWAIAWTFCDIDLGKLCIEYIGRKTNRGKPKIEKPVVFITQVSNNIPTLEIFSQKLKKHFEKLEFVYKELESKDNFYLFDVNAYKITWTHQRRMKREQLRLQNIIQVPLENVDNQVLDEVVGSESKKRLAEDDEECGSSTKKIKLTPLEPVILNFSVVLDLTDSGEYQISMTRIDGTGNRDVIHQIMQYFKNNLK